MFDKNKVKLGIAPIAWTNDDMPDLGKENTFEQCVSEMALAGCISACKRRSIPEQDEKSSSGGSSRTRHHQSQHVRNLSVSEG